MQTDIYSISLNQLFFICDGATVLYYDVRAWTWGEDALLIIKMVSGRQAQSLREGERFLWGEAAEWLQIGPRIGQRSVRVMCEIPHCQSVWTTPEGRVPDPISPFKKNNNDMKQLLQQAGGASYVPGAENELFCL